MAHAQVSIATVLGHHNACIVKVLWRVVRRAKGASQRRWRKRGKIRAGRRTEATQRLASRISIDASRSRHDELVSSHKARACEGLRDVLGIETDAKWRARTSSIDCERHFPREHFFSSRE